MVIPTGEIVAEFAQQDQEYTVDYSVPSRVTAKYATQQGIGRNQPHSSLESKATEPHKSSATQMWTHRPDKNHMEIPRGYHDGKTVEGVRNLGLSKKPQTDPDFISDSERPVPKPRYVKCTDANTVIYQDRLLDKLGMTFRVEGSLF